MSVAGALVCDGGKDHRESESVSTASADQTNFEHPGTLPICVECRTNPTETSQLTHYACAVQCQYLVLVHRTLDYHM